MKKLIFSAVGIFAVVGTALAVINTNLGGVIYRQGPNPGVCNAPVFDRTIVPQGVPNSQPDFATLTFGAPCRNVYSITLM